MGLTAKEVMFRTPIASTVMRAMQTIPVDRLTRPGRGKACKDIAERIKDSRYPPVLVFPQGTTVNHSTLTMFMHGAFTAGVPVQPVCIRFPHRHYDHFQGDSALYNIYRACCQFINFQTHVFLPPYSPNPAEIADPDLFARNVRQKMAEAMQNRNGGPLNLSEHKYRFKLT